MEPDRQYTIPSTYYWWKVRGILLGLLVSCVLFAAAGCNANRAALEPSEPQPQPAVPSPSPDVASIPSTSGSDVGERLGRLDAQMRTAPPDSQLVLRAEYQRILDSIDMARHEPVQTGGPEIRNNDTSGIASDSSGVPNDGSGDFADSTAIAADTTRPRIDTVQTGVARQDVQTGGEPLQSSSYTPDTLNQKLIQDPSKLYRGLRPSELRNIPGYVPSNANRMSVKRHPGRSRMLAARRRQSRTPRYAERYTPPHHSPTKAQLARMTDRRIVNGIAATQAGRYSDAIQELGPALGSAKSTASSSRARHSYALSLEKTGQLSRAADQYLRLSRGGGAMGQKAYVAYCRMLAKLGQRDRAKRLVLQFIQRNPDSTSVVSARRLLQVL